MRTVIMFTLVSFLFLSGCTSLGEQLFKTEGCMDCHSFKGQGGSVAPDLTAVTSRRSKAWIIQQLEDPAVNNPNSRMPNFSHLTWTERTSLYKYLDS